MEMHNIGTIDFRQNVDLILEIVEQPWCKSLFLDNLDRKILFVVILKVAPMYRAKLTLS